MCKCEWCGNNSIDPEIADQTYSSQKDIRLFKILSYTNDEKTEANSEYICSECLGVWMIEDPGTFHQFIRIEKDLGIIKEA